MTNRKGFDLSRMALGLRQMYGLDVRAFIERRTVLGIVDAKGTRYMWKQTGERDDEARLQSLANIICHLAGEGIQAAGPLPTLVGAYHCRPYPEANAGYLQPWLSGRHVDIATRVERECAIRTIAKMHQVTQEAECMRSHSMERGQLLGKMRMKARTIQQIWPEVTAKCPALKRLEEPVLTQIAACLSTYEAVYREQSFLQVPPNRAFCHRDLAPHNLLWQGEVGIALIDFDHAGFDDPLHDVLQLASHSLFLSQAKAGDLRAIVAVYDSSVQLTPDRRKLLWRLLAWPDILIRTVVEWYRSGCRRERIERVYHAIRKEQQRRRILQVDAPLGEL